MNKDLVSLLANLKVEVYKLGQMALEKQFHLNKVQNKGPLDLLTEVDLEVDQSLRRFLEQLDPGTDLWLEESGFTDAQSDWCWIADPIDGTVNYSHGLPLWGISVALLFKGEPVLGLSYLPALDEMYSAIVGTGFWSSKQDQLYVSKASNPQDWIMSNGDYNVGPHPQELNHQVLEQMKFQAWVGQRVKSLGSAVVESCWVAAGRLDVYVMEYSHPWDIAAGALFVREAGGVVCEILETGELQDPSLFRIRDTMKVWFGSKVALEVWKLKRQAYLDRS
jgi:myo-inositol-1(or 4)-monophosphatase